ncbi:MAG: hypothetical protein K2X09_01325 [Rickettsiales bacterium]|nr:hypothetical protein [Rickettsiales bacterium]
MTNPEDTGAIPHARVEVPTKQPQTLHAKERENAVISCLKEIAGEHDLKTLYMSPSDLPHSHTGQFKLIYDQTSGEVTLIIKKESRENLDNKALDVDVGQLFGILKLAANMSQLPRKREERQQQEKPIVAGAGITFASMDALEKAVHAVDPWANKWTGQDVREGR